MKKTQFVTSILLGAASISGFAQSNGSTAFIKAVDDKKFAIYLNEPQKEHTNLFIKDQDGSTLYFSKIKGDKAYAKVYNMSQLSDGEYQLVLEGSKVIQTIPLQLDDNNMSINNSERITVFKPHITHKDNFLDLMVFSPEKGRYELTIYDSNNSIVYNRSLESSLKIEKRFDISGLKPGNYNVMVTGVHGQYSYTLPVD